MKLRAKKIEWTKKNHYYGILGSHIVCSIYKQDDNRFCLKHDYIITPKEAGISYKTLTRAKQKAQEILDKFVNDIGECIDE